MQLNLFSELYVRQTLNILNRQIQQKFQVMHFSNYRQIVNRFITNGT